MKNSLAFVLNLLLCYVFSSMPIFCAEGIVPIIPIKSEKKIDNGRKQVVSANFTKFLDPRHDPEIILSVPPPNPFVVSDENELTSVFFEFEQPEVRAVVAWNGQTDESGEELLILAKEQRAIQGCGAVVGIMPLPGKPLSVKRITQDDSPEVSPNIFHTLKEMLISKWNAPIGSGPTFSPLRDLHNVYSVVVLKIDGLGTFEADFKDLIEVLYDGKATPLLPPEFFSVIKGYHDLGFRYFAFEISYVNQFFSQKEIIAYHFQSKSAYFPLVISKIGGQGNTFVDLVVLTPDEITRSLFYDIGTKTNGFKDRNGNEAQVTLNGTGAVDLTKTELNAVDKSLADFFANNNLVKARNFLISGEINTFFFDFVVNNCIFYAEGQKGNSAEQEGY